VRLGIDLDGVVADFNTGWTRLYNAEFGAEIGPDSTTAWNAPAQLPHFGSMSAFWRWARTCGPGGVSLFRTLEPYPGALEALGRLSKRHRVVIITTKPRYAVHDTYAWIAEHQLPTTEVHIVDDKSSIACDVYLEDADHNLVRLAEARPEAIVCRFVRPWNHPQEGVVDVADWDQFELVVERLETALS
jgi:5'(3')-deoxyribonucleotidase